MRASHHPRFDMYHSHGWRGARGGWFFPPLALFLGFIVFLTIIKTGLWLPLLLLGLFMGGLSMMRGCQMDGRSHGWSSEKWKRDWSSQGYAGDKPKRDGDADKPKREDYV